MASGGMNTAVMQNAFNPQQPAPQATPVAEGEGMFCPNCGTKGAGKFCMNCGTKLHD